MVVAVVGKDIAFLLQNPVPLEKKFSCPKKYFLKLS